MAILRDCWRMIVSFGYWAEFSGVGVSQKLPGVDTSPQCAYTQRKEKAMQADFTIHSGWGDHIDWLDSDFNKIDLNRDTIRVYGHMSHKPKVGDTLMGEFQRSFIKFEFVTVKYETDPPDMFFGEVRAIEQEMKEA